MITSESDSNNCLLSGRLVAAPTTGFADEIPMLQTAFTLEVRERLGPGEVALTWVPCLAFGQVAAQAGGFEKDEHVFISGHLGQGPTGLTLVIRSISPTATAIKEAEQCRASHITS